ncbi:hypothetical protein KS4_04860 [Poriferisphaera corsica]|uniref:Gamma-butyrobetaine hydroxylase-like N-terminal domain-containing protein n=1 Tax=Poriferisphaera corsica TaxID=2528020 RepID=A0A517YQF6_9BACT|nr:DUF971 domain-containing protein [Poriferisphaera corsica]QDU32454.1 hypothetical protein KS4_04860 [Poriferisphaera corsica]
MSVKPKHIDVKRDKSLQIDWSDGRVSVYEIRYLRKMSPSAEEKKLREEMRNNPLTILPSGRDDQNLLIENVELVGNYAIRIFFSDGHHTGIYSWSYLRSLDATNNENTHSD